MAPINNGPRRGPTCHHKTHAAISLPVRYGASFDLFEAASLNMLFPTVPAPRWGLSPPVTRKLDGYRRPPFLCAAIVCASAVIAASNGNHRESLSPRSLGCVPSSWLRLLAGLFAMLPLFSSRKCRGYASPDRNARAFSNAIN